MKTPLSRTLTAGALLLLAALLNPTAASAQCTTDPVVTSTAASGPDTLDQATIDACPGSTITFDIAGPGPHTILLGPSPIFIEQDLTISGPADERVIIDGDASTLIFYVDSGVTAII